MEAMASKKKRNKKYRGVDAAKPTTFTKVSAVKRNPVHQWFVDHRRMIRPALITLLVAFVVIVVIIGVIDIIW